MSENEISQYRIVIFGSAVVGKSALTIQFIHNHFLEEYDPSVEDSYRKQVTIDQEDCILDMTDTSDQEEYAVMHDRYVKFSDGFFLSLFCVYYSL
jgi:GTPase KRas protein